MKETQSISVYDVHNRPEPADKMEITNFLFTNLEEYGDSKPHIKRAIEYAIKDIPSFGGFVLIIKEKDAIAGAAVINKTGMGGYIPENILVYIATLKSLRGKGLGKKMMKLILDRCKGDIALHVEKDNPARFLYEKTGFVNPYLEMRLKRSKLG